MSSSYGINNNEEISKVYLSEIQQLKLTIQDISEQNRTLSSQNSELHSKCLAFNRIEQQNRQLIDTLKEKDEKINLLEGEKLLLEKAKNDIERETDLKYFKEITYLKNQLENNQQKIETANIIIKLNEKQHNRILELEKTLEQMMNHESELLKQNEIKHENQFTNLKKKMMDHIKTAQKNMAQSNLDNLDLNTKLSKLTTNQLLIELEEQSTQIEELLKTKEKYEKEIFSLKTDLNTHKRVEQILQEKNKKYLDMVKNCDKKLARGFTSPIPTLPDPKKENSEKKNRNFEKLYKKQNKDYYQLKDQLENLKEKEKMFENKFSGIINLYKMAIDDLIKDEEFKNITEVNINIEDIKNGNFENFSKKKKYSILVYLLKHLLPLISDDNAQNELLKQQFSQVEINNKTFCKTKSSFNNYYQPCKTQMYNLNNDYNNKTFTKFPKIEHLYINSQKNKNTNNALYKILTIK